MTKTSRQDEHRIVAFLANPRRALWKLSWPILGGMALMTLYSLVDMMFVGWVGSDAVAALAFNMPLVFLGMGITMGLATGATAAVAQAIGAKEKTKADNTAEHAVVLGFVLGLTIATFGLTFGSHILTVLGAKGAIHTLAWSYFKVICWGMPFSMISAFFRGVLAGEGDTLRPMIVTSFGVGLNMILDPLLIFGLNLGVRGAAYATVISQLFVFSLFIYLIFHRRVTFLQFQLRSFRFHPTILAAIFRIGFPASLSFVFMSAGQAVYNRILSDYSQYAVAAYQIAGRVEMVYFMPIMAIAASAVTLAGMFYGAGEYMRLREIIRYTMKWGVLIGLTAAALVYPFAPIVMQIFKPSDEILAYGVTYLRIMALVFPLVPIGMISGRVMQGLGKGMPFMILSFLRVIAVGTPLAVVFSNVWHKPIEWVWFAMISGSLAATVVGVIWLSITLRRAERLPGPGAAIGAEAVA
ncbi:MATE family efflux transporter [Candidatus Neomarinimicrobiota bacterium]